MLYSRMRTLPVYSTSSFRESFAPALECYYNEAAVGDILSKARKARCTSFISPTFTAHLARPARRLRRLLSHSRSAAAHLDDSTPLLAYETSGGRSDSFERDYEYTRYDILKSIKNRNSRSFESYNCLNASKEKSSKIRQKYSSKRKLHTKASHYNDYWNYWNNYNLDTKLPKSHNNYKTAYAKSLLETPVYNENCDRRANTRKINSISPELNKTEDAYHHFHGYASDDSIAETTIHVSLDRQYSFDDEGYIDQTQTRKQSNGFESLDNNLHKKKNLSLELKTSYDDDFYCDEQCMPFGVNEDYRYYEIPPTRRLKPTTPEESDAMFKKMYISRESTTDTNDIIERYIDLQDEELMSWKTQAAKKLPKIPTRNGHHSQSSLVHRPTLDRPFKHLSSPNINNAYCKSLTHSATNHVDQEYSKMANSLSVGLSPTNLGSPRGVLTSVAPHLPPDDTHHNTTEATTYLPAAAAPPTSNAPTEGRRHSPTAKPSDARINADNPNESECSNDYGGRENGRGSQQQPLERRESRRGQFTRSLSNADGPPDEKAGKYLSIIACMEYNVCKIKF